MSGRPPCHLCRKSNNHPLQYCSRFRNMVPGLRQQSALAKGYCLNCLCHGHKKERCPSQNRCKVMVNGTACGAKHHSLFHPDESSVTTKQLIVVKQQSVRSGHSNILMPKIENLQLVESTRRDQSVQHSPTIPKKEFVNKATQTPAQKTKMFSNQGTQTPKVSNPAVTVVRLSTKEAKLADRAQELVAQQPPISTWIPNEASAWPILPPLIRVNINYNGHKMFTTFVLDVNAKRSYILEETAKMLPEFVTLTSSEGKKCGKFILEPWFEHDKRESFMMYLPLCERLGFVEPTSLKDESLGRHFASYKPLAHPLFHSYREIDGVLGQKVANRILKHKVEQPDADLPQIQMSTFGWIVSGPWKGCSCHTSGGVC